MLFPLAARFRALAAEPAQKSDTEIKCGWLMQFLRSTTWPPGTFPNTNTPLMVTVIGNDSFGSFFDDLQRKGANGKPVVLKRVSDVSEAKNSHVVFVSATESKKLDEILETIKSQKVLTLGETREFVKLGGIVNLTFTKDTFFEFNKKAIDRSGLQIDSRLLAYGKKVE